MPSEPVRVAACICTYRRNEPLRRLLTRLAAMSDEAGDRFVLGVVVVDDNPGATAMPVVESFADRFPLGAHHHVSGHQNISMGRNIALAAGVDLGEFIVMTDDDCLPDAEWITALLDTQLATSADAVSGPMLVALPDGAPDWLTRQGVFDTEQEQHEDGAVIPLGQTNNCLIRSGWLRDHPSHRFDPEFGRIGGEDMVFFRGAVRDGLRAVHSAAAIVRADEPADEVTLRALVKSRYWWGNSESVTNLRLGDATKLRLGLRGGRRIARAVWRPVVDGVCLRPPRVRANLIAGARGAGMLVGAFGVRVNHH